jgi:hypothetical protein
MPPQGGHVLVALTEMKPRIRVVVSQDRKHKLTAERVPQEVCEVLQNLQLMFPRDARRVSHTVPARERNLEKGHIVHYQLSEQN